MKRIFLFLLLLGSFGHLYAQKIGEEAVSFESQKSEWGLGVEGGFGAGLLFEPDALFAGFPDAWLAISLHIPETSFLLSAGLGGIGPRNSYGLNANIDFALGAISPADWFELHMFLGAGASIYIYDSSFLGLSAGIRLPLGMSFWLWKWMELYANITPIVGLGVGTGGPRLWIHFDAPVHIGVRFWF